MVRPARRRPAGRRRGVGGAALSAISCRGLAKRFGPVHVLADLDLDVADGTVATILGTSGSGKTTLLRLIAGFERSDGGTITLGSEVVDSPHTFVPPEQRRIGFVAQDGNLFPHLTVAKNVAFGLPRAERRSGRAGEMLDLVGLADLAGRYPHQLSGGQQQRVALARALAPEPALVLLDEPFSSLDAGLRASLRDDVMRILRDRGATALLVTHDQSEALSVADAVGILIDGRIRQMDPPAVLYDRPADPATARFLGEANLLDGVAADGAVTTAIGSMTLADADGGLAGPATVLVRPEQIDLRRRPAGTTGPAAGRVVQRDYHGHDMVVLVDLGGGGEPIRVRCAGRTPVAVGDTVALAACGEAVAWPAGA